jgi:hypothetical protein
MKVQKILYFRQVAISVECLFGEKYVRQIVRSCECPFDKMSVGKLSFRQIMSFGKTPFRQCPATLLEEQAL